MRYFLIAVASGLFAWLLIGMVHNLAAPSGVMASQLNAANLQPTWEPHGLDEIRLTASDPWDFDRFGRSVAINGDYLIVGAPGVNHPEIGEDTGAAYVFQRRSGAWQEIAKLFASDPQPGSGFGFAVTISGDRLAVGSRYARTDQGGNAAGVVYVFSRQGDSWFEEARITARDGGVFHLFGHSVALDGDTLVVGARGAWGETLGDNRGAAYVFHHQGNQWIEQARLTSLESRPNDFFGHAVAVKGDTVAVGAYGHDDHQVGQNSGVVYVYQREEGRWYQQARLLAQDASPFAQFGSAVALAGPSSQAEWLLVGANQEGGSQETAIQRGGFYGAAYVFEFNRNSWQQTAKWKLEEQPEYGLVGESVAIGSDERGNFIGAVGSLYQGFYLFDLQKPGSVTKPILGPTEWAGTVFGQVLALSDSTLVVGAHQSSIHRSGDPSSLQRSGAGAVFIYDLEGGVR
jgi:hypothetical protein